MLAPVEGKAVANIQATSNIQHGPPFQRIQRTVVARSPLLYTRTLMTSMRRRFRWRTAYGLNTCKHTVLFQKITRCFDTGSEEPFVVPSPCPPWQAFLDESVAGSCEALPLCSSFQWFPLFLHDLHELYEFFQLSSFVGWSRNNTNSYEIPVSRYFWKIGWLTIINQPVLTNPHSCYWQLPTPCLRASCWRLSQITPRMNHRSDPWIGWNWRRSSWSLGCLSVLNEGMVQ